MDLVSRDIEGIDWFELESCSPWQKCLACVACRTLAFKASGQWSEEFVRPTYSNVSSGDKWPVFFGLERLGDVKMICWVAGLNFEIGSWHTIRPNSLSRPHWLNSTFHFNISNLSRPKYSEKNTHSPLVSTCCKRVNFKWEREGMKVGSHCTKTQWEPLRFAVPGTIKRALRHTGSKDLWEGWFSFKFHLEMALCVHQIRNCSKKNFIL